MRETAGASLNKPPSSAPMDGGLKFEVWGGIIVFVLDLWFVDWGVEFVVWGWGLVAVSLGFGVWDLEFEVGGFGF